MFKALYEDSIIPTRATKLSAGYDLYAHITEPYEMQPWTRAVVDIGVAIDWAALPPLILDVHGYEAQVRPRSGLAFKHGITVLNSPGTIDADYALEVKVMLVNFGCKVFVIEPGMRIAQLVFSRVYLFDGVDTERLGGLGSTGT